MSDLKNDIAKYLRGELSAEEMHRLEKSALSDPFLADALEGASITGPENFLSDTASVQEQLSKRGLPANIFFTPWRIAASILLALGISYVIYWSVQPPGAVMLATEKKSSSENKIGDSIPPAKSAEADKPGLLTLNETKRADRSEQKKSGPANEPASAPAGEAMSSPASPAVSIPESEVTKNPAIVEEEVIDIVPKKETSERKKDEFKVTPVPSESKALDKNTAFTKSKKSAQRIIQGQVSVSGDLASAAGINVTVKGTGISTVTDADGNYTIPEMDSTRSLVFSSKDYATSEVKTDNQTNIDIHLSDNANTTPEVVVSGAYNGVDNINDPTFEFARPVVGNREFNRYLRNNLKYPKDALEKKIQGKVTVGFTVRVDGKVTDFNVIQGLGGGCNEELVRLISEGPAWLPQKLHERAYESKVRVRLKFVLPK